MYTKPITAATLVLLVFGSVGIALSDHDRDDDDERHVSTNRAGWLPRGRDVEPVTNAVYTAECGACHLAYPPGLLPSDAWGRVMDDLSAHYGDDASLDTATAAQIRDYLIAHGADGNGWVRSRAFAAAPIPGDQPPRITHTRYFQQKHDEVPTRLVRDNPGVVSFSRCESCHQGAQQGRFNEDDVRIPGLGRWDD